MKPENAIEVHDITKSFKIYLDKGSTIKEKVIFKNRRRYENRQVLKGISFEVKKGEAIGLVGHNGCGKSTTLKLLTKIMYPDSGTIEMKGRVSSLIELGAGFHPDMSGRENIYINASIFGLSRKEIDERLDDIIAFSELEEFIDNPVRTYSSGMYMRLAFSVAINVDADILLIDEILAVGDANFQAKCFNRLREIKAEGTTIVIVSHSLGQIEQICERSIWINKGEIVAEGTPYDVHAEYLHYMEEERQRMVKKEEKRKKKEESLVQTEEKEGLQTVGNEVPEVETETKKEEEKEQEKDRWGQFDASFRQIRMLDAEGEETSVFSTGDKVVFSMDIKVKKQVEDPVIGIGITRNDGTYCYGTNTQIENIRNIVIKDGTNIRLELEHLELLPGQYYIDFEIKTMGNIVLDYYRKAFKLEVVSTIMDVGMFRAKHNWIF